MSHHKVRKVVIPAAGFGTRFLPYTKASPKEMLPIVDKPVIQFVVEDAVSAGIEDVIIVTGSNKRAVEDHFDYNYELEKRLEEFGKEHMIKNIRDIADLANFVYVRQKGPYGNATPIKCARHVVGDEPFLVFWGDDFFVAEPKTRAQQMVEAYEKYQTPILCGVELKTPEDYKKYGVIEGEDLGDGTWRVTGLTEKPGIENAKSNLGIISYLLTPEIFPFLENQEAGLNGEYYLPEAIDNMIKSGVPVHAITLKYNRYYDTGNKLSYIKTVIEMATKHPEIGEEIKKFLKEFDL